MRGKKHCVICKKRFRPDPRVGDRQRCCGAAACSRARHLATKAALYQRDKDDIGDERLARRLVRDGPSGTASATDLSDLTSASGALPLSSSTIASDHVISRSCAQVRWEVVSSELGRKSSVILRTLAQVADGAVSSEMDARFDVILRACAKAGGRRVSSEFARAQRLT